MIKSLTSLRGIFILFIFFHHCLGLYPGGGSMAVAFFFVLGGFSMTLGYRDRVMSPKFSYRDYITKRCIKFYPLHWLCILAVLPIALLSFRWIDIPKLVINAALLQTWIPISSVYFSFNWVSWYLADTMFFAVVFPWVLKCIVKANSTGRVLIVSLMVAIYVVVAILLPIEKYHAILYISPYIRLMDFVFGIFLALLYLKLKDCPAKWGHNNIYCQIIAFALIVLLVIESCLLSENVRLIAPVYWPLISILVLILSLSSANGDRGGRCWLENRYLQRLGELSFVIFLIHQIVLRYTSLIFTKIIHFENNILYISLTLVLTIVLAIVVERYILNPITQWLTKRIQPSMIARS